VLHEGDNVIVSNVFCGWRDCGLGGQLRDRFIRLRDGSAAPLTGPWRVVKIPEKTIAPSLPWAPTRGLALDYNGVWRSLPVTWFMARLLYWLGPWLPASPAKGGISPWPSRM
jgi:sialate O-acetylesterase